jgi:hypothetical protein
LAGAVVTGDSTAFFSRSRCGHHGGPPASPDSFLTTAYLRKGRFGPLEKRDLAIFAGSSVLSCAAWTLVNEGALAVIKSQWEAMK